MLLHYAEKVNMYEEEKNPPGWEGFDTEKAR